MSNKVEKIKVVINIDNVTIGDLELMDRASKGHLPSTELVDFLDRIVEGDVRSMPLRALMDIIAELERRVDEATNPVTEEGN